MRKALHDGGLLHEVLDVRGRLVGVGAQALDGHLDGHLARGARRARDGRAAVGRGRRRALARLAAAGRRARTAAVRRSAGRRAGCRGGGGGGGGHDRRAREERAPDLAELARAEALLEVQTRDRNLPAILRALTQIGHQRSRAFARIAQRAAQAISALCESDERTEL